jgi:hypothetical protein
MIEHTHICDQCGARHTGDRAPISWKQNVRVTVAAEDLPSYSPWSVIERRELLCDNCLSFIAEAVKAALERPTP